MSDLRSRFHVFGAARCSLYASGLTLLLALLVSLPALAQSDGSPTEAMLAANQNYEAGQFAEAVAGYEALIKSGLQDGVLYYNLGNAYFKQGDLGRAILNYRRAQRLDPRDPDIMANLNVARAQTIDQIEVAPAGSLSNLIKIAEDWLTLREAANLAVALWLLIALLALLAIFLPRLRRLAYIAIAGLSLFLAVGLISMANRYYSEQRYPPAVIVAPEVNVTSGPGTSDQYLLEFSLHAGAEVHFLESRPGWRRIALPGDLQGWVSDETVVAVIQG
jgi:tetratricopeptide (TPR) repeat protein